MKKSIRIFSFLLTLALCLGLLSLSALAAAKNGWVKESDGWHYYKNDTEPYSDALFDVGGTYYYVDGDGVRQTGWVTVDGTKDYYADEQGEIRIGWLTLDGKEYYISLADGRYEDGVYEIDGMTFGFNRDGVMQTRWAELTSARDGELHWHYFDAQGVMSYGWIRSRGIWYYLDYDNNGEMVTGLWEIDGKVYGFKDTGAMAVGWAKIEDGSIPADADWYYFDASGAGHSGWVKTGKNWYYTENGAMLTGWAEIGGKGYYFQPSGIMATGWVRTTNSEGTVFWYYFDASGAGHEGWLKDGENWYYFRNGVMVFNSVERIGSGDGSYTNYYFRPNGTMGTGWVKEPDPEEEPLWYYFDASGAGHNGWLKDGGNWYYCENGEMYAGGTRTIDGTEYTFSANGVLVS